MLRFGELSIGRKLSVTVLATAGVALLLACSAFLAYDVTTFRRGMVRHARVLAELVAINGSAALTFTDSAAAEEVLRGLGAESKVLAAGIYDANGAAFASYRRAASGPASKRPAAPVEIPTPGAEDLAFSGEQLRLLHEIRSGADRLGTVAIVMDTTELRDRITSFVGIVTGLLGVSAAVGLGFARRLQAAVSRPLSELVGGSERAAGGDLSVTVPVESNDELGLLARAFNDMTHGLREVVSQVRENIRSVSEVADVLQQASHRVSSAARKQESAVEAAGESVESVADSIDRVTASVAELASVATDTSGSMTELDASVTDVAANMDRLAESIESSSASIMEITTSIERVSESIDRLNDVSALTESSIHELHASVQQVEGNARQSREISESAHTHGEHGRQSVQQTISAMNEIKSAFSDIASAISRLAQKSGSIGAIVKVIQEVAEETSLLSLNAAIIASQAGSHGKAFSVVAGAVKELAERTARSTREISSLVDSVQADTAIAVQAMGAGSQRVDRGVSLSREAGEAIAGILDGIERSVRMVSEIGDATDAQARDLAQVDRAVAQMRESVVDVSRAIQDQQASSGDIRRGVEHIRVLGQEVKRSTTQQSLSTKAVTAAVERVSAMVQEILRATREQTKGSEQIRTALQVFREVTEESARTAEEMRESVATLSNRSTHLQQGMGRFTL